MPAKKKSETAAETKQVVKKEEAALPISMEEMEALSGQGFEEADRDAYAIPFLRLIQSNSPQCDENEAAYIEGAKPGMLFNTITNKLYGRQISIISLHYGRSFIEWKPNRGGFVKDHGGNPAILDRIVEIDDKNNSILDNGNVIQDTRNHFLLIADDLDAGPIILSLTSTGVKHSRKWMTLMNNLKIPGSKKQAPMFAGVWSMSSVMNQNDDGKWYQIGDKSMTAIEMHRWVNKEELEAAQAARELVTSGEAKADWDSTIDERSNNGGSGRGYEADPNVGFGEGQQNPF